MATRVSRPGAQSSPGLAIRHVLLPLRLFLGGTFLYAGLDKLIDPRFLADSGAGSIGSQLQGFARDSPLAFLITHIALHAPVLIGIGMALLEIAIGIGTLLGVAYRLSTVGGLFVATLFWLTASWSVQPYFLGPDLPYAMGWLTLTLAGDPGWWTARRWLVSQQTPIRPGFDRRRAATDYSPERRRFMEAAALGAITLAVAGPTAVLTRLAGSGGASGSGSGAGASMSGAASATASASSPTAARPAPTPLGTLLARGSDLARSGYVAVADPATGDPVLVIRISPSQVVAYDAVCTHAGCTVEYDPPSRTMFCPCHGAQFDAVHHAAVLGGPTSVPLTAIPITVDAKSGDVRTVS